MVDNMGNGGDGDACLCGDFFDGHKTPPCWHGLVRLFLRGWI